MMTVGGPAIGSALIRALGAPAVIEGSAGYVPPPAIYWASAAVMICALIPVLVLRRRRSGVSP